ncbi:MAG: CotH kinase family protein [Firmicutes bacterium]|nr:CotH kinase family protein [Bacillota bacterium]
MKKVAMLILIFSTVLGLTGCDFTDYMNLIESRSGDIERLLPRIINSNFTLPIFEDVEVIYELNGHSFTNEFIYESPFYDQDTELKYSITKNSRVYDFSTDIHLLADDSGYNHYKIYLNLPVSVTQVTKDTYMQASVTAVRDKNGVGVTELVTDAAQIRGRGNSTWFSYPKKPFRLRFDNNTSLFGMPEAKDYVLLAEYADKSLMRNTIVQKFSSLTDNLSYTLETRFVELYINTVYMGLYVLAEQVEFQKNKLDVESIPGLLDTGYLIELDMRFYDQFITPGFDWIVVNDIPYEIKEPKTDDPLYTSLQADFMFEYMTAVENALIAQVGYEELLDVDGWIDFFIIHELTKNVDVGFSSVFYYKEAGGPLRPGPLWDFDFAIGNADYIDYGPENFYGMKDYKNRLFKLMIDVPEIRLTFRDRFSDIYFDVLPEIYDMIPVLSESISSLADRNFAMWDIMDIYIWPNPAEVMAENTFLGQVSYLESYLHLRSDWMYETMLENAYLNGVFE